MPLPDERLAAHLRGAVTLGAYQLRDDGTAGWLCFDADADIPGAIEHAHALAAHLRRALAGMGFDARLEDSGNKGGHVWVFFCPGVAASDARRLGAYVLDRVLEEQGEFAGVHVEIFPKQDAPRPLGNLVKVPLGVHKKTGRRALFVGDDFMPIVEQAAYLATIRQHTPAELAEALEEWGVPEAPAEHKIILHKTSASDQVPESVLAAYRGADGYERGAEVWGYCPFCPNESILGESSLNRDTGAFWCFGCGKGAGWHSWPERWAWNGRRRSSPTGANCQRYPAMPWRRLSVRITRLGCFCVAGPWYVSSMMSLDAPSFERLALTA